MPLQGYCVALWCSSRGQVHDYPGAPSGRFVGRLFWKPCITLFTMVFIDSACFAILKEATHTKAYQQACQLFFDDADGNILLA
jgi:hypothetical protein